MGKLTGKNILITGGNSGIGLAAAQEFDREGARVAICGLNESSLQAAKETLGAESLALRADVSNLTDLDAMFATIKREFGHLDGVLVNAGYSVFLPFEDVTEQSFDKVIGVDFKGVYFTIQKALPLIPAYSISKAAAFSLSQSLRALLAARGVRVHAVLTGPVDTDMSRGLDIPKASPESVARAIFDGVQKGEEDIFPDPMSESMAESWRSGAAKALERQNAAFVDAQAVPLLEGAPGIADPRGDVVGSFSESGSS